MVDDPLFWPFLVLAFGFSLHLVIDLITGRLEAGLWEKQSEVNRLQAESWRMSAEAWKQQMDLNDAIGKWIESRK